MLPKETRTRTCPRCPRRSAHVAGRNRLPVLPQFDCESLSQCLPRCAWRLKTGSVKEARQGPGDRQSREMSVLWGRAASKLEKGRRPQRPARTSSWSRRFPSQFQPPGMLRCLLTLGLSEPRAGRRVSQVARRLIEDIPYLRGVYCVAGRKYMKKFIDFKRYKLKARPHTRVSRVLLRG